MLQLNSWPIEPRSIINDGFLPLALGWLESNDYNRVSTRAGKAKESKAFSLTHTCTCEVLVRVRASAMHSQNLPLLYMNLKSPLICLTPHSQVFPSRSCIMICPLTKHYCDMMTCMRKAQSCPVDPLQAFWQDACKWIETPPGRHEPGPYMDTYDLIVYPWKKPTNQPTNQPINKPSSLGLYSKREFASQSMFRGLGCKLGFRRHRWRDQGHLALTEEILAEYVGCIQRSEMVLVEKDKLCGPRWHNQESRLNGVEFG